MRQIVVDGTHYEYKVGRVFTTIRTMGKKWTAANFTITGYGTPNQNVPVTPRDISGFIRRKREQEDV